MERLHQTREEAIKWHRKMWTEMRDMEGDDCYVNARTKFKKKYVQENFPGVDVTNDCFLCCYALNTALDNLEEKFGESVDKGLGLAIKCKYCPLKWGNIENCYDCEDKSSGVNWMSDSCLLIAGLEERTDNI